MVIPSVSDDMNQNAATDTSALPTSSILARLRAETREAHKDLERVLDLTGSALTHDRYRRRLEQYVGFYGPLEAALRIRCTVPGDRDGTASSSLEALVPRLHKTALLQQDLQQHQVSTKDLPLCRDLPSLETPAEVLGCFYVLEGATLGGRMIAQHISTTLGITSTTGGSFFEGYAGETGTMWHAMRHILVTCAVDVETEDVIVENAIATFTCLRQWCEPDGGAAPDGTGNTDGHMRADPRA